MKQIDLQPFVSKDESRYQITFPRIDPNGKVFATDGRVLICGEKELFLPFKSPEGFEDVKQPDYLNVLCKPENTGKPLTLPEGWQDYPTKTIHCECCNGLGRTRICKECNGMGYVTCDHCDCESRCKDCNGECEYASASPNDPKCENCNGEGKTLEETVIFTLLDGKVNSSFGLSYLKRLYDADPGFVIHALPALETGANKVSFTNPDILGAIMRRREDRNLEHEKFNKQFPNIKTNNHEKNNKRSC